MIVLALILAAAQLALFAFWAYLMFKTLFGLARRARARTGKLYPNPVDSLHEFGLWLTSPTDRPARFQLGFITLALFASTFGSAVLHISKG